MAAAVALMRAACEEASARRLSKISRSMREDAFLGFQDFGFQFLQFRRGEALGVDQRLLALVIGGREVHDWLWRFRCNSRRRC